MTASTMTLAAFTQSVLPLLRERHRDGAVLATAIKGFVARTPIVDDDGHEVDIETLAPAEMEDGEADEITEARVSKLVDQALKKLTPPRPRNLPVITESDTRGEQVRTGGFAGLGEFALAVHKASAPGSVVDQRLITKAPTTFAHEGAGGSGGFLVPAQWAERLWQIVLGEESLLSRTNQIPTSRNALSLPVSQTTPWGTAGVQAYWMDEAEQVGQSRPQFEYRNLRLHKLAALVPASDELLEDAAALDAIIGNEAGRAIRYKADDAILHGDGVGKPLGLLHSAALVTVDKESEQSSDTVLVQNIVKMYARMPAPHVSRAVWLINQDVVPQLLTLTLSGQALYMPPNGIADSPFGTLLGRPVILSQHCRTLGETGDVIFADLSQYLALIRAEGLKAASSIHLWFDYDVTAFRFTFRLGGQPWLSAPITPANSSDELSPFVALQER